MHGPEPNSERRRERVSTVAAWALWALALALVSGRAFAWTSNSPSWQGQSNPEHAALIAASTQTIALGRQATRVVLEDRDTREAERGLDNHVRALPRGRRLYLVLKNFRAAQPPGVLYHLYLDLPENAAPRKNDAHHVGILNFFGVTALPDSARPQEKAFRSYEITALAKRLHVQKLVSEPSTITIISSTTPAEDAQATIGRIEIVEQ